MIIDFIVEPIFGVNSYIVKDNRHCILIDPIGIDALNKKISNCIIDFIAVTHEHFDHIRDINCLKQIYDKPIICGEKAKKGLANPSKNMSQYLEYLVTAIPFGNHEIAFKEYSCDADLIVKDNQTIKWQGHIILFKETPGHSRGSISILIDNKYLFSGDTIFKDYQTATKLPGGSTKDFRQITEPWLNSLSQNVMVYPGHTEPFKLLERFK